MTKLTGKIFAWDFHGTLEQGTEVGFAQILRNIARKINYKRRISLEEVRKYFGISVLDYLKQFFPTLSNEEVYQLREYVKDIQNQKHIQKYIKPAPYAHEVLAKIKTAGHKNIIISTSSYAHINRFLEVIGVIGYFDEIFGIDRHVLEGDFDIAREKTQAIEGFAQKHKIKSKNIVVIGDRSDDINAGINIGAKTYQYITPDFPHIATNADFKIYDLREILREL
ncbi:hypothetical protein A3A48_04215 [Candidatus Curtissbacteria bacterium RIFCSPLOWO2_01_FULL_37_9]|uniref:Uncharacterized protein n=1 Tax=Candidatus Curtissbacteria bacterium RIFCSPLOWO2_01_FULL_37_9 TaxID=1797724 RepID=A0A1F5GQ39_9BACT|nr:MAG: hypothetical protein A3A48_04215 [Candidatus Curtissbacteria bacterium RIFCSPLOWO2_01_FULL_37_9]